jgi:hypothetical protein
MRRLRQMQQTSGGRPGGVPPQMPRGAAGLVIGTILLAGGAYVVSNSIFNVDGGQRAIKYRRISGVSKEIFNEGTLFLLSASRGRTGHGQPAPDPPGRVYKGDEVGFSLTASQERISTSPGLRPRSCTMSERSRATSPP